MVLGQQLPDATSEAQGQLFALSVATVGLAAFALVLALVEQVGSPCSAVFAVVHRSQLASARRCCRVTRCCLTALLFGTDARMAPAGGCMRHQCASAHLLFFYPSAKAVPHKMLMGVSTCRLCLRSLTTM